jgi:ethylbenzene hydroxylase subunit beta/complex iron-sulfur molybdoenzyme family reductase subunit beta
MTSVIAAPERECDKSGPPMGSITEPKRQLAWVFDLNKCGGCQDCSAACKSLWTDDEGSEHMRWMTVNSQPGRGTPRDWQKMGGGYNNGVLQLGRLPTEEECRDDWDFNSSFGDLSDAYLFHLPRLCNHCSRPACVEACPNGALFKREEDGLVLRDEARCSAEQQCARICPYKKIYFNRRERVSQHCSGCLPLIERGVAPACVRQCPERAAFIGFLDDEASAVSKLVERWRVALPLHPEFGTQPNVYYVPPLSPTPLGQNGGFVQGGDPIPAWYLESLFGSDVHESLAVLRTELERKQHGEDSALLDTLLLYRGEECLGHLDRDPAEVIQM